MGDRPEERASKGCAAFVNLIFSLFVLLVLMVVLLPNTISMPDWFESFRNITLVEKRKAWGAVYTFTYLPSDRAEHLLIFNTRTKTSSLKDALNKEKPKKELQAQLTLKLPGASGTVWDKKLSLLDAEQVPRIIILSESEMIYALLQDRVWALDKSTGEESWQASLSASLLAQEARNVAINPGQSLMILLDETQKIVALDLKTGNQAWQQALSSDFLPQFYLAGNSVVLLQQVENQQKTKLVSFDVLTGQLKNEKLIPTGDVQVLQFRTNLYLLTREQGVNYFQAYRPDKDKELWKKKLPDAFQDILPANITHYQDGIFFYFLSDKRSDHQVWKIDNYAGKISPGYQSKQFQLSFLQESDQYLFLRARPENDPGKSQLWAIHKKSNRLEWQYNLEITPILDQAGGLNFSMAEMEGQVYLIERPPFGKNLDFTQLDAKTGALVKKKSIDIPEQPWSGVAWTGSTIYCTLGDVIAIELGNFGRGFEWP